MIEKEIFMPNTAWISSTILLYAMYATYICMYVESVTYFKNVCMYVCMYVCMRVCVLTYLLLCCALEHGVHEAAEHDQQLLLVDVAQPQRGPTCMYVCSQ